MTACSHSLKGALLVAGLSTFCHCTAAAAHGEARPANQRRAPARTPIKRGNADPRHGNLDCCQPHVARVGAAGGVTLRRGRGGARPPAPTPGMHRTTQRAHSPLAARPRLAGPAAGRWQPSVSCPPAAQPPTAAHPPTAGVRAGAHGEGGGPAGGRTCAQRPRPWAQAPAAGRAHLHCPGSLLGYAAGPGRLGSLLRHVFPGAWLAGRLGAPAGARAAGCGIREHGCLPARARVGRASESARQLPRCRPHRRVSARSSALDWGACGTACRRRPDRPQMIWGRAPSFFVGAGRSTKRSAGISPGAKVTSLPRTSHAAITIACAGPGTSHAVPRRPCSSIVPANEPSVMPCSCFSVVELCTHAMPVPQCRETAGPLKSAACPREQQAALIRTRAPNPRPAAAAAAPLPASVRAHSVMGAPSSQATPSSDSFWCAIA
jgi:hypothetical protein